MGRRRLFIAIDISNDARDVCSRHIEKLRSRYPGVRVGWERSEKLHITVKFLGDVDDVAKLRSKLDAIASEHRAFTLCLSSSGVFPSARRPRILWIGVDDVDGALAPIFEQISEACAELGFSEDERAFKPHLTIGRLREPEHGKALALTHLEEKIEPVEFEVADIVIYESKLQPTGSIYSVISRSGFHRN